MSLSISSKTKIRHNNGINETFRDMNLPAKRVVFLVLAQVDSKSIIPRDMPYRIYASDYARVCDLDPSTAYKQLKLAVEQLQRQLISIPKKELLAPFKRVGDPLWKRPEGKGFRVLNVTEYCDYEADSGYIDVVFTRQMEPYISMLSGNYTSQILLSAARLNNGHSSSFYQLIRENISKKKNHYFDVLVDDLKKYLGLYVDENNYNYPLFKDFNKIVLKRNIPIIEKLTEIKDITVTIIGRKGRKAYMLRIGYRIDEQTSFEGF
jgi:plasmid replication initiation protein